MIEVRELTKTFITGELVTPVLKGIDLTVKTGEFLAIMGRSGAGKSTLMYQMSLLDVPTSGSIVIDDTDASSMTEVEKVSFRLRMFGYVFQEYALLPELTAVENVAVPLIMQGLDRGSAETRAADALVKVGLEKRLGSLPSKLSGGEQQRVAIARAVAHTPGILFADEPTANLDRESSASVLDIFQQLHADGQTIIMVTHEEEYGMLAERIVRIDDGKIVGEITPGKGRAHRRKSKRAHHEA
jgi:putative ABC transport system ATP-binding protein